MAPRSTKPAKLDPEAHEHVTELQNALWEQGLPRSVDRTDILSALVLYTPAPQLEGMLREYWRYTRRQQVAGGAAPDEEDDE
jgi:hypothetical protein